MSREAAYRYVELMVIHSRLAGEENTQEDEELLAGRMSWLWEQMSEAEKDACRRIGSQLNRIERQKED